MSSSCILKIDLENLFYRTVARIAVVKNHKVELKEFLISIYTLVAEDCVKISIINTDPVTESYTSMLTRNVYEELKKAQNLFVDFVDFPKQLQGLFKQFEDSLIDVRINLGITLQLGFYAMCNVKELTLLAIPLQHTSQDEIISFMQKRSVLIEARYISLYERTEALQAKFLENKKKFEELEAKNQVLEFRFSEAEYKCAIRDALLEDANNKNQILLKHLELSEKTNSDLNLSITKLRSDIDSLKIRIDYYVAKTTHLQSLFDKMEKTTVPLDKCERLNNMFCSASADLLKCQIHLKQILSAHEFHKSENYTLKEELTNCIEIINNLETKLKNVDFNKSAEPKANAQEDNCDLINEMIQKLELQNAATTTAEDKK